MCEELLVTVKAKNANKCRFGFPCSKLEQTELFTETNTRISQKWSIHIRIASHEWRGNTDAQVIIDSRSATNYISKYACKGE